MYMNEKLMLGLRTGKLAGSLDSTRTHWTLTEQALGKINLPTGQVVANDPLCLFETAPFERAVAPGSYPVMLYIFRHGEGEDTDRRVAFAEIRFREAAPVRFELALAEGQSAQDLGEDEFYGYGVDSGTGSFMDTQACAELKKIFDESDDGSLPPLENALQETYVHTYSTANIFLPGTEHNVVAFSSGYGDGAYPSYWGIGSDGMVSSLVTDFLVVESIG